MQYLKSHLYKYMGGHGKSMEKYKAETLGLPILRHYDIWGNNFEYIVLLVHDRDKHSYLIPLINFTAYLCH